MDVTQCIPSSTVAKPFLWKRDEIASALVRAQAMTDSGASQVEQLIGQFGQQEDLRLGQQMPKRNITLCEDETFHPQICLVAIEPVSNFLILEAYADKRDVAIAAHQENLKKAEFSTKRILVRFVNWSSRKP